MGRRLARELAFRTLFQSERGAEPLLEVWHSVRAELAETGQDDEDDAYGEALDAEAIAFADGLLRSYDAHRTEVDGVLEEAISGWTFGQMSQTDLNVLRLAVTEMRYVDGPPQVPIEMAVRLAKKFGGDESGRFVNGVLAKVLRAAPRQLAEEGSGGR